MTDIIDFLITPFGYEFMRRAFLASLLVASICSVFSCFLIIKGWSLMGDAVSHAVLPGVALAYIAGWPLLIGAFIAGLFCSVATGYIKDHSRVKEDAVLGIMFSGMFALGLVLLTKIESDIHLLHILFGNILGVNWDQISQIAMISIPLLCIFALKWRDLMLFCFDPAQARVSGMSILVLHYGLLIALALTVVSALHAAGIILVIAMLIAPGATGFLLTNRFSVMLAVAMMVSVLSCVTGIIGSFYLDLATAPLIVIIQAMLFSLALLFSPLKGLLKRPGRAL